MYKSHFLYSSNFDEAIYASGGYAGSFSPPPVENHNLITEDGLFNIRTEDGMFNLTE